LHATILTNVEVDHLEHFGSFDAIVAAFDRYLAGIPGPRVVGIDDSVAAQLAARHDVVTYGTTAAARYRAVDITRRSGASVFVLTVDGERRGPVRVPLRGLHNVRNAAGALAMADQLGVPFEAAVSALARFGGVARRFEIRARHRGVTLVDDYAQLPTEIAVVIDAARGSGDDWRRVVAVFQPNRFRRMAVMSPEYRDAFSGADLAVITEIYPSGYAPIPGVTGRLVVDAVGRPPDLDASDPAAELIEFLAGELTDGDVCISMDVATRRRCSPRCSPGESSGGAGVNGVNGECRDRAAAMRGSGRSATRRSDRSPPTASAARRRCSSRPVMSTT
jgi:UDP-N-acetylmuramate--alanine ligase